MRNSYLFLLIALFVGAILSAQVKIGDNPQNIDPSSVLELESTDRVLVITRVTTAQMNAIVPSQGALCFNTDLQSVHYYNGTQWVNVGGGSGTGGPLTADPIVNTQPTIVITPTATGDNLEVAPNSIRSEQIVDGGVNGVDIQNGSIGPGKLQDNSVTQEKLSENSVGAFALDNDNIGVSAFNNDLGYITAGDINIVSGDIDNVLETRTDGVFYNDQPLITAIDQNTDAIALDDDQSAANEIQNPTLTGTEIGLTGTEGTIDIGPLIDVGGSDNQNLTLNGNTIEIEDGNTIDLTPILGAGGSDDQNLTLNGNTIEIEDGNTIDLTPILGAGGSDDQTAAEVTYDPTDSGLTATDAQAAIDEIAAGTTNEQSIALDLATNQINLLNDDAGINSSVKLDITTLEAFNNGTDDIIRIKPAEALTPVADQMLITNAAGTVEWAPTGHTGTTNSVFYAGPDGGPITVDENANPRDDRGFYWDPNGRDLGGTFQFGALYIGLEPGNAQSNAAKVHIADNFPGLSYALHLQNFNNNASKTTGILFSTANGDYGKGSLIFDSQGTNGQGDFHFLQNGNADTGLPLITDKAFTITSEKHIGLYGGIDIGGAGTGFGANNQVLASGGPGNPVKWVNNGGLPTATADGQVVTWDEDALGTMPNVGAWVAGSAGGTNLSTDDLTQELGENRTYNLNGQNLFFTGAGNIGVGTTTPGAKFHVNGGQVRAATFSASDADLAYRFSDDADTGIYSTLADDIGFKTGGQEILLLSESAANGLEITAKGSLELDQELIDVTGNAGDAGQILSSTGAGVEWISPKLIATGKANGGSAISTTGGSPEGTNGNYTVTFTNNAPNSNYIIQLTVQGDYRIYVSAQRTDGFDVVIIDNATNLPTILATEWFYTATNL